MATIVQHKSAAFDAGNRGGLLEFDSPVTKGNLIVAVVASLPDEGGVTLSDTQNNGIPNPRGNDNIYSIAIDTGFSGPSTIELTVGYAIAGADGTLQVVVEVAGIDQSCHLHIYEVSGVTTLDQVGQNFQTSTENAAVSTSGATIAVDEFVLAAFANASGTVVWTLGGGLGGEETTNEIDTVATGGETASSVGIQTATATSSVADDLTSVIVTFSALPATGPGPFLGSVVVSDSDGDSDFPFLGSVTIISGPPAGNLNGYPFLGRVKLVSAPAGNPTAYPYLGTVIMVDAPEGNPTAFPYLGTVKSV